MLNTIANFGAMWVSPLALTLIDSLTTKACLPHEEAAWGEALDHSCDRVRDKVACHDADGVCVDMVDGYELLVVVCTVIGGVWWWFMYPRVKRLEARRLETWHHKPMQRAQ